MVRIQLMLIFEAHKIFKSIEKACCFLLTHPAPVFVGLSGGIDSCVLLILVKKFCDQHGLFCQAIHINHGLQAQAVAWERHCQQLCAQLGVPLVIKKAEITAFSRRKQGLEGAARAARFALFFEQVPAGGVLCLAHHLNDQAETFLLHLMRGSGVLGLGAIRERLLFNRRNVIRPLLSISRVEIEQFAAANQLGWVEDPSNQDDKIARNYLRHKVLPFLHEKWPHALAQVAKSALFCQETQDLLDELASDDLSKVRIEADQLDIDALSLLSMVRQKNLLRFWFRALKVSLPSKKVLNEIIFLSEVQNESYTTLIQWGGVSVRRFRKRLMLLKRPVLDTKNKQQSDHVSDKTEYLWHINLADTEGSTSWLGGKCLFKKIKGQGISCHLLAQNLAKTQGGLRVKRKQGGEKIKPADKPHHRHLKNIFQEQAVPVWMREICPLLYFNEALIALPKIEQVANSKSITAEGWQVTSSEEQGIVFSFELI